MPAFRPSEDLTFKILEALGMSGKSVRRLVIDADCAKPVRVYVEYFPEHDAVERLVGTLTENRATWATHDGPMPDVTIDAGIKTC